MAKEDRLKGIKFKDIALKDAIDQIHEIIHEVKTGKNEDQRLSLRKAKARSTKS